MLVIKFPFTFKPYYIGKVLCVGLNCVNHKQIKLEKTNLRKDNVG